jgi:hypothetical protein
MKINGSFPLAELHFYRYYVIVLFVLVHGKFVSNCLQNRMGYNYILVWEDRKQKFHSTHKENMLKYVKSWKNFFFSLCTTPMINGRGLNKLPHLNFFWTKIKIFEIHILYLR